MARATAHADRRPAGGLTWRDSDDLVNALLLTVIAIVLVIQVFSRYVLNHSLGWTTEIATTLLAWLMFLGAPAMLKRQSHMEIYLFGFLGPVPQTTIRVLIEVACGVFYAIIFVGSLDLVRSSALFTTPALGLRGDVVTAIVPVGTAYLVVRTIIRIIELVRGRGLSWLRE